MPETMISYILRSDTKSDTRLKKNSKKQNIVTEDKYVYYISINQTLCSVTMIGKIL